MDIQLPYGNDVLKFDLPEDNLIGVLTPQPVSACTDPDEEIRRALAHPLDTPALSEIARPDEQVLILVDDHTRVTPVAQVLPHLLEQLQAGGVPDDAVAILIANGTHRLSSKEEVVRKVGEGVYKRFRILQHQCTDQHNQMFLGVTSRGTPVWVNRLVVETDRCVGVGHIDPHTFAGFAGGCKLLVPGVASLDTINANHSLVVSSSHRHGSVDVPCRLDIEEAAAFVRVDLLVNVVLSGDGRILQAFAGSPGRVFREGTKLARQVYEVSCPGEVDVVIASAYPYDLDLYQAVRAVQFANNIVRKGGSIMLVARCDDGVGSQDFYDLLALPGKRTEDFLRDIARCRGAVVHSVLGYMLARIRAEKRLYALTDGIPKGALEAMGFRCPTSIEAGVEALLEEYGKNAKVVVFPMGSTTLPRVSSVAGNEI